MMPEPNVSSSHDFLIMSDANSPYLAAATAIHWCGRRIWTKLRSRARPLARTIETWDDPQNLRQEIVSGRETRIPIRDGLGTEALL